MQTLSPNDLSENPYCFDFLRENYDADANDQPSHTYQN
jgi:hypothetical protein